MASFLLLASIVGVGVYFFLKLKGLVNLPALISSLTEVKEASISDYAEAGGVASVAKRQGEKMLSTIMKNTLNRQTGGLSEAVLEFIPELDGWIEEKPYGVSWLLMNPIVQKMVKQFMQTGIGNFIQGQPQLEHTQGVNEIGKEKTAWWQA